MISLRLAIPAVLVAAIVAGCITHFVIPVPPQVETVRLTALPPPPHPPKPDWKAEVKAMTTVEQPSAKDKSVAAFEQAAEGILRRLPSSAAAFTNERAITGPIPLPRKRPIPR